MYVCDLLVRFFGSLEVTNRARKQPTIGETRKLLLAALRLWELKNGDPDRLVCALFFTLADSIFLMREQLHDARNRPTDATVHIDSWVVACYRTRDNRSTAPN